MIPLGKKQAFSRNILFPKAFKIFAGILFYKNEDNGKIAISG